jgi:hypothetical protein
MLASCLSGSGAECQGAGAELPGRCCQRRGQRVQSGKRSFRLHHYVQKWIHGQLCLGCSTISPHLGERNSGPCLFQCIMQCAKLMPCMSQGGAVSNVRGTVQNIQGTVSNYGGVVGNAYGQVRAFRLLSVATCGSDLLPR